MELRRFFRAPLLLISVAVLLLLFVLDYANSGNSYQQVDTSEIVSLINQGQVKSALITDKNQTIQITTKSGKQLQASWVSGQGLQLVRELQALAGDPRSLPLRTALGPDLDRLLGRDLDRLVLVGDYRALDLALVDEADDLGGVCLLVRAPGIGVVEHEKQQEHRYRDQQQWCPEKAP